MHECFHVCKRLFLYAMYCIVKNFGDKSLTNKDYRKFGKKNLGELKSICDLI